MPPWPARGTERASKSCNTASAPRSSASALYLQVLVRRGVREALDVIDGRLLHAGPDAPEERELVDRHVQHAVVHDLLDLVQQRLALLAVELARLPLEEILDLGHDTRRIDAVLR